MKTTLKSSKEFALRTKLEYLLFKLYSKNKLFFNKKIVKKYAIDFDAPEFVLEDIAMLLEIFHANKKGKYLVFKDNELTYGTKKQSFKKAIKKVKNALSHCR